MNQQNAYETKDLRETERERERKRKRERERDGKSGRFIDL